MIKPKLVFTDEARNKLYVRYINARNVWQWSAKNAQGKFVDSGGVRTLMQRALRKKGQEYIASKLPKAPGMR